MDIEDVRDWFAGILAVAFIAAVCTVTYVVMERSSDHLDCQIRSAQGWTVPASCDRFR